MDREHEFQRLTQAEQDIAEGAEHIKWQREVVGILERISACAEATEGARALLTILIKTQAQREQDGDQIRASLDGDVASPSAVPLAHVLDHQTDLEIAVQREHHGDQIRAGLDGDVVSPSTVPLARLLDHQTDLELTVQREQGGDQIRASLEGDAVSPSTVPLAQPVDHQTDLEIAVQREQDGDQIRASLEGDAVSPSTVPLAQPVDHQKKAVGSGDIAEPCENWTLVQVGAKTGHFWWFVKTAAAWISNLGRARSKLRN